MQEKDNYRKWLSPPYTGQMLSREVCSATESTGAIPTPPLTQEDIEGYLDVFPVPQCKAFNAVKADTPQEQESNSDRYEFGETHGN